MTTASIQDYVARQDRVAWRRRFIRWLTRTIGYSLLVKIREVGQENIPPSGPAVIMMNHLSLLDPVICIGSIQSRLVIPMSKIENTRSPLFAFLVWMYDAYTVDRDAVDRSALLNSIELLKSGQLILIAPEGTRHPEGLAEPKDGVAYVATKANAVIVPTALTGSQDFQKHWKRLRRPGVQVTFGRPFRFKVGEGRLTREQRAAMMREAMHQLALTQPDPALRGVYSDVENATTEWLEFVDPRSV